MTSLKNPVFYHLHVNAALIILIELFPYNYAPRSARFIPGGIFPLFIRPLVERRRLQNLGLIENAPFSKFMIFVGNINSK